MACLAALGLPLASLSCDDDEGSTSGDTAGAGDSSADTNGEPSGPGDLEFPPDFIFGAASSAHQIEGNNTLNNWYQFETLPQYAGQTVEPSGFAANGYALWETDDGLVEATHLDSYRFSIEWSRIMPTRHTFDEAEIAHYRAILEDLRARGIRPFVTLHHFTDPIWLDDLTDLACADGPSDDNLCGWTNPDAIAAFVEFVTRMAQEYGDLVDDWSTFNEPNTYSHIGFLVQQFPPGHPGTAAPAIPNDSDWMDRTVPIIHALIEAHVAAYEALHEADTADADGDGTAASVGWTQVIQYIVPADSESADDVFAADRYRRFLNTVYTDPVATGEWDPDFDGTVDEEHPEWVGKQDFIGVQYYTRTFVLRSPLPGEILVFIPCQDPFDRLFNGCPDIDPLNRAYINEVYPEGLYESVRELAERYPGVPLPITENGSSTDNGERKAQVLVRYLEQVARLIQDGYPVPAYYYWSLTDNFEWAAGFAPRLGLYRVDYASYERTPTRAQEVMAEVAETRVLRSALREELGVGPLLPDSE